MPPDRRAHAVAAKAIYPNSALEALQAHVTTLYSFAEPMNPRNWHLVGPLGVNHFHWLPHCLLFWNCDAGRTLDQTSPASMRWDGGTTNETGKDVYGAEVESDARECEDTEEDLVRVLTHLTVTTNATAGYSARVSTSAGSETLRCTL